MKKKMTLLFGMLLSVSLFLCQGMTSDAKIPGAGETTQTDETDKNGTPYTPPEEKQEPNPFSTPGNAEVVDQATNEDGKEFYIIETPDGNLFYLIIDNQREQENVYFTSFVAEEELLAFVKEKEKEKETGTSSGQGIDEQSIFGATKEPVDEVIDEPVPEKPQETKSSNPILLYIAVAAAVAGAGYYLKIYKPKKEQESYAVNDDFEDDDDLMSASSFDKDDFNNDESEI